jgi:membrane protein insertase Oxa1/YidC/SpoIIIJ
VNPLAGCLPTLVQIPVFIGLYRSVLQLAQKDLLEESFLWIPSLQVPLYLNYYPPVGFGLRGRVEACNVAVRMRQ